MCTNSIDVEGKLWIQNNRKKAEERYWSELTKYNHYEVENLMLKLNYDIPDEREVSGRISQSEVIDILVLLSKDGTYNSLVRKKIIAYRNALNNWKREMDTKAKLGMDAKSRPTIPNFHLWLKTL